MISKFRMKKFLYTVFYIINFITGVFFISDAALGAGSDLTLKGTVIEQGCDISIDDFNKIVNLGDWSTRDMTRPGGHTEPVNFAFRLSGCAASGVTLTFTGHADPADSGLLALSDESSATGVAVEIMNAAHRRQPLNEKAQRVTVDDEGNAVLSFTARYLSVGGNATPGSADADSEFTLTYD